MNKKIIKIFLSAFVLLIGIYIFTTFEKITVKAETPLITTEEQFNTAYENAREGDTLLVGDITFTPMLKGFVKI